MMERVKFYDKVYGCWLGKNIGGTLGAPVEGNKNPTPLPFEFPKANEPNDDLDLQLVWLAMLREKGIRITAADFAKPWTENIIYPYDEYGICRANLERGLVPPLTGKFNNYFADCMGSPIRSEIWGCIASGMPETAAYYALQDSQLDHYTEGICGEIFFSVVESLAFQESDILKLSEAGLSYLPAESEVAHAIRETLDFFKAGKSLSELRESLVAKYDRGNFSNAILNLAFTMAGILYENSDFLRSMVTAVNLGYDTDCTGATSGAIIGIIKGATYLKEQYKIEFDNRVIAGWGAYGVKTPGTIEELTEWTIEQHDALLREKNPPKVSAPCAMPAIPDGQLGILRTFRLGNFSSVEEARKADSSAWTTVTSKNDFPNFDAYVSPGKKLYYSAVVRNPSASMVRIIPHAAGHWNAWIDGEVLGSGTNGYFAPSPHRHWGDPHRTLVIPENGCKILIELTPDTGLPLDFSLMIAREDGKFHEIHATVSAD